MEISMRGVDIRTATGRFVVFSFAGVFIIGCFLAMISVLPVKAGATTHYVGGVGPSNYTAIQAAIDAANPGDTIYVFNGTYRENVVVNKTVSLVGEDRNSTVVDGGWAGSAILVRASWVNVSGFSAINTSFPGVGIEATEAHDCLIENNYVSGNGVGIWLNYANRTAVLGNSGSDNQMNGILVWNSADVTIRNNTVWNSFTGIELGNVDRSVVDGNSVYNNTYGIRVDISTDGIFTNNTMVDNGIFIDGNWVGPWDTHTIDASNTVNGKPVRYLVNMNGGRAPSDAGEVILVNSNNIIVENLNLSSATVGVELIHSQRILVANNSLMSESEYGAYIYDSASIVVKNITASTLIGGNGIHIESSTGDTIRDNVINGGYRGIYAEGLSRSLIANNTLSGIYCVDLETVDNVTIANNSIAGLAFGVFAHSTSDLVLADNIASAGGSFARTAMGFFSSTDSTLARNTITGTEIGVEIDSSRNATLFGNIMIGEDIWIAGDSIEHWNSHNIDTSNLVNGHPVYYWKNVIGGTVPSGGGQVILANSTNVFVTGQDIDNASLGIQVGFSNGSAIKSNNVSAQNEYGISVEYSDNITIEGNRLVDNARGVNLHSSTDIVVQQNVLLNNSYGLFLTNVGDSHVNGNNFSTNWGGAYFGISHNNTFTMNNLTMSSERDIVLGASTGNSLHHNNFYFAPWEPWDDGSNSWDDGYPSGGNYWGGYAGVDLQSGPLQDQPGGDGIGDTPYAISGGSNNDRYPLMKPFAVTPARPPTAPLNLRASAGLRQITLNWDPPSSSGTSAITNYRVYRSMASGGETPLITLGNVTTYIDSALTGGQPYYYKVSAVNSAGEGNQSNEASSIPTDIFPPSAPLNLRATAAYSVVSLMWDAPSSTGGSPITNYMVYRGTISGSRSRLADLGNRTFYIDMNVMNGQKYYYTVSARNAVGEGPNSTEINATPSLPTTNNPPVCNITAPLQNVSISGTFVIAGTASDSDGIVARVEISIDGSAWTAATGTDMWTFSWNTKSVANGSHIIRARSYDGSNYSAEASVVVFVDNAPPDTTKRPPARSILEEVWFWGLVAMIVAIVVIVAICANKRRTSKREAHELSSQQAESKKPES